VDDAADEVVFEEEITAIAVDELDDGVEEAAFEEEIGEVGILINLYIMAALAPPQYS